MTRRYRIDPGKLTVVLTSCGRFDLLAETIASFLDHFDVDLIVVADDAGDADAAAVFAANVPKVDMRVNNPRRGQMRSIDGLYASAQTPYVVHLEDDWKFTGGVDLDKVVRFLEARPDVSVVCIGYRFDKRFAASARKTTHESIDYWVWDLDAHPKWFSYSFNPSVGRVAFWREHGPYERFKTEEGLSQFAKGRGLRIAMLIPSLADHIGDERHAEDPFQPKRAKTPLARLKRSIAKRWERITGGLELMGLSCCIISHNEGDRIERCIRAARGIVDEIVVVDSGSTDDTVAKVEALGAKVTFRAWDGYGPQKRFAEDCASHDWILNLDADEVVTPELAREIAALMHSPAGLLPAYRFRQVTVYPGHARPRLWADYHNYVRLYDRRRVRFRQSRVHDTVDTGDYPVGQLDGVALHYSWRSLDHVRKKLESYTDLQAKELKKSRREILLRLPLEYPILFFRYYVLRRNFTGGLFGVQIAHTIAWARARRLVKILRAGRKAG